MRIAQLISRKSCDSGGSLQALLLAASLKEMGEDVVFVSKGKGCAERAARFGVRHFSVPMKGYLDWRSLIRLGGFVRKEGVDVAHAHKGLALWFSLVCAAVFRPEMKVFANRGVSFPLGYWGSLKYRHPLVKGIICVAYAVKNQMARAWVSPERLKVVYGSVNPKFFSRISQFRARKRFGLDSRNVVFALVGNFRPWKGHLLMAEAVSSLLAKRKDVFCLFAGKEKRSILDGLKRYLGGSFASLGYREDAEYVIAASDVLVNASTEGEGRCRKGGNGSGESRCSHRCCRE